ncbi:MAG: zinc ribbon domain-containing protein [Candidatus Hermodarchaeota archaeon]
MSDNNPEPHRNSYKRFSEILYEGFRLFGENFALILPLGLLFVVSLIIKNLLIVELDWQLIVITPDIESILEEGPYSITAEDYQTMGKYLAFGFSSIFLDILIPNIFNVIAMCLVSNYLYKKFIGKDTKIVTEMKKALNKKLLMVTLLLGVVFSAGWMILIPGIIIFGFLIFYVFTYNSGDIESPIREARYLAKGEFWKIIAILFFNNILILACDMGYQLILEFAVLRDSAFASFEISASWYDPSTRNYGLIILHNLIINLVQILFAPLLICLLTPLYAHLKRRKEQYLREQTSSLKTTKSHKLTEKEIIAGPGIFCPFCGEYMKVKFQFCMHCGEKLNFEIQK